MRRGEYRVVASPTAVLRRASLFVKATAVTVVVAFLGLYFQPLALAAKLPSRETPTPRIISNDDRLARHLERIEEKLERLRAKSAKSANIAAESDDLKVLRGELETLDHKALEDFNQIERHITDKKLPNVIQQRHTEVVKIYRTEMANLKANLDDIDVAKNDSERRAKSQRAKEHLKAKQKKRLHQHFDPAHLPFRAPDGKYRRPKTAIHVEPERTQIAALENVSGLLLSAALIASPTPADLAETVETKLTPEMRALAQGLSTPVAIYELVRNGFEFEPYAGSVKGSVLTYKERGGNDWDIASLLIALYRAVGIPARYALGTVEIPIDRVMSWLGVDDPRTAANLLASTGRNAQAVVSGGKIVAIRTDRVWVHAYVPFNHHRGAKNGPGDTWVDVDPSFKVYEVTQTLTPSNLPAFDQSAYLTTLQTDGALDFYRAQLQTFLDTTAPGHIPDALVPIREIVPEQFGYLVGRLPYKTLAVAATYAAVPEAVRQKLTLNVLNAVSETQLTHTTSLTELLDKRLTLSYDPASAADAQTISAFGGLYRTPPYLIALKPQLKLDGQVVADGSAVGAAQEQQLEFQFVTPNGTDIVRNTVTAGEYYAIALNAYAGGNSRQEVADRAKRLEAILEKIDLDDPTTLDERLGELLYLTGRVLHHNVNTADRKTAKLAQVVDVREVSEMMYFLTTKVTSVFGVPRTMTPFGVTGDFDRNVHLVMPKDGDASKIKSFMQLEGNQSSFYEHATTENVFNVQALSAVKALQTANSQNIPVHTVTPDNVGTLLPTLQIPEAVKTDIRNATNQGWHAIVPAQSLTLSDWSGVGYILQDPENGQGFYRIAGGYNGAVTLAAQDTMDRIRNLTGSDAATSAKGAADRSCKRYPGEDRILGTLDDPCFRIFLQSEAEELDGKETGYYAANPYNYDITEIDLIRPEDQKSALLTKYLKADQWLSRDEDGAEYMRAGHTIILAVGELMKQLKVTKHGIDGAGSGYRTRQRQIQLRDTQGIPCLGKIPDNQCLHGHHLDGTAADIHLTVREDGGSNPTKEQVLCIADFLIGHGEVLHEGTSGTVHIAKPAKRLYRDWSGTRKDGSTWSWRCRFGGLR